MRGGSRYSTAPPTKRGVDMSYPKAGLRLHPILFGASGSRKNAQNAFPPLRSRRHDRLGEECKTQPPSEDRRYNKKRRETFSR